MTRPKLLLVVVLAVALSGMAVAQPPAADRIKPGDRLRIRAVNTFEMDPLSGLYRVEPGGTLAFSPIYGGRVRVEGLTLVEAEKAVVDHVKKFVRDPKVTITRYDPDTDKDEAVLARRIRILEQEVRDLRAAVEELRQKRK